MQSRNRILFTAPLLGAVAACGSPGLPAKATVVTIDHECVIIESTGRSVDDPRGGGQINASEMRTTKGECKSVDEWAEVRKKRNKKVDGTAAVHVEYRAPQDGSFRTGTLNFTGRDDEFYELKAGDTVDIVVAKDNPDRIRKS